MHTRKDYFFHSEKDATTFTKTTKDNKSPIEDLYVDGPFYLGEMSDGKDYWKVSVESFK